jgi:ankyrin repeat protein
MHAATVGRETDYNRIRSALGPGDGPERRASVAEEELRKASGEIRARCEALGVTVSSGVDHDIAAIVASYVDPGPFLAYTHGDPCPDNNAVYLSTDEASRDAFRLIDYEIGGYRHALRDGVYGRIRFPTCWCVRDLPEHVIERMEVAYRAELVKGCPAAADDDIYLRAIAECCGGWVLTTANWSLRNALDYDPVWGVATHRQRVLMRLEAFADLASRAGHLESLGETARRLRAALHVRWEPYTLPIAMYPAFARATDPPADRVEALARAIDQGDLVAARSLLDQTPGLVHAEARDAQRRVVPMLTRAIRQREAELVRLLLERGADWRRAPRGGAANLVLAAELGDGEIVRLLFAHGALPDARDASGFLPLHAAAREGHHAVVALLLARGAALDVLTAIYLDRFVDAQRLLQEHPEQAQFRFGNGDMLLHLVARRDDAVARYVPLLVEYGAPLSATVWPGRTALHIAAEEGHSEIVGALLAAGADPSARTQDGATPLALAEARGHLQVAAQLRQHARG